VVFKVVIALVLLGHGIGHSMGLLQIFKVASVNPQWNGDSWILTGPLGVTATQVVGGVLWTAAIIGFAALAGSVIGWLPAAWFQPLAIGSSVVSLAGVLLFPVALLVWAITAPFDRRKVVLHALTNVWGSLYTWINPLTPW
jgi:hypothetical protein